MSNSFITLQFNSRFNITRGQLKPNQGPIRKEKKSTNCLTGFSHCDRVHYQYCKFHELTHINIICPYLFISLPKYFL